MHIQFVLSQHRAELAVFSRHEEEKEDSSVLAHLSAI